MRAHKRQTWDITAHFLKQDIGFRWGAKGWQVVVRGLVTERERCCQSERAMFNFSIYCEDILSSGWISAEIRIGKVFFPSSSAALSTPVTVYSRFTVHTLYSISTLSQGIFAVFFTQFRRYDKVSKQLKWQYERELPSLPISNDKGLKWAFSLTSQLVYYILSLSFIFILNYFHIIKYIKCGQIKSIGYHIKVPVNRKLRSVLPRYCLVKWNLMEK